MSKKNCEKRWDTQLEEWTYKLTKHSAWDDEVQREITDQILNLKGSKLKRKLGHYESPRPAKKSRKQKEQDSASSSSSSSGSSKKETPKTERQIILEARAKDKADKEAEKLRQKEAKKAAAEAAKEAKEETKKAAQEMREARAKQAKELKKAIHVAIHSLMSRSQPRAFIH